MATMNLGEGLWRSSWNKHLTWSGVLKYMPCMPCRGTCTSQARRSRSRPPPRLCVMWEHHQLASISRQMFANFLKSAKSGFLWISNHAMFMFYSSVMMSIKIWKIKENKRTRHNFWSSAWLRVSKITDRSSNWKSHIKVSLKAAGQGPGVADFKAKAPCRCRTWGWAHVEKVFEGPKGVWHKDTSKLGSHQQLNSLDVLSARGPLVITDVTCVLFRCFLHCLQLFFPNEPRILG